MLLALTRPEAAALGPLIVLAWAWIAYRRGIRPAALLRLAAWPLAAIVLTMAALTLFRLQYFGYPLPNTFYAKVSPSFLYNCRGGLAYLRTFLSENPAAPWALAMVLWVIGRELEPGGAAKPSPALVSLAAFAVRLRHSAADSDRWRSFRRLAVLSTGLAPPGRRVGEPGARPRRAGRLAASRPRREPPADRLRLGGSGRTDEGQLARPPASRHHPRMGDRQSGRNLGAALERHFPDAKPRIGVITAGGVRWTYRGEIFDLMGLNDVQMGHSPGDRHGPRNHAAFDQEIFFAKPLSCTCRRWSRHSRTSSTRDSSAGSLPIPVSPPPSPWRRCDAKARKTGFSPTC